MRINVERIDLSLNDKMCIISDIHHIKSCTDSFYNEVLLVLRKEKPKYILIPGDIIDHPDIISKEEIKYLITFLTNLSFLAKVIISKGNHELKKSSNSINDLYAKLEDIDNLYILDNKSIVIDNYQFIGFSPSNKSYLKKYKDIRVSNFIEEFNKCNFKIEKNKTVILLSHSPKTIIKSNIDLLNDVDFIICGHMHNGLVPKALENIFKDRGLFGPDYNFFPKHCRGIFNVNKKTKLIVCKSLRVVTKDNLLYNLINRLYANNITIIN